MQASNQRRVRKMRRAPGRFKRFVAPEGSKKVRYEQNTEDANATTFTHIGEDHTLGNVIRMQLYNDRDVLFTGYRAPDPFPLMDTIEVKVQTTGRSTPLTANNKALADLRENLEMAKGLFKREVRMKKLSRPEFQATAQVARAEQETELQSGVLL